MGCQFCGRWGNEDCKAVACLGCGTVQCFGNGGARGTCSVCHYGILPGWSGSDCQCKYAGCKDKAAFLYAPRKGSVCARHANQCKVTTYERDVGPSVVRTVYVTLAEYAKRCAERPGSYARGLR